MLEQLHDAYERLAQALEAQRRFVADASHELRTPLTTIRGNAGLLATGPAVSDEVRSAAAKDIATEAERMSRLVEHLLTLAEADAGQRLTLAPVALRQIIADVCRQAQAVHLDRTVRSAGLTDATVPGDADALTQLLWILVDNAVKFTSAGGHIELGLQQHEGRALLTVADDGTGIPASDLERIFTRFYQVDASRSGTGSGLGLSIAAVDRGRASRIDQRPQQRRARQHLHGGPATRTRRRLSLTSFLRRARTVDACTMWLPNTQWA